MEEPKLNFKAILNKDGSITATWSKISDGVRYQLCIFTPGNSFSWLNKEDLKETSYTTEPFESNKLYWVELRVYSSEGAVNCKYYSVEKIFIPYDFYDHEPLPVPENVRAAESITSVTIDWKAVPRANNYDILFNGKIYNVLSAPKTIYNLNPKTSYSYSVCAKNTNNTSPYSPVKTIKTSAITPSVPTSIIKTVTENSAAISWGAVSMATGYDIIFDGITYNTTGTSRTFTGLASGRGYQFQIRAKNADGPSGYTNLLTVTTAPKPPAAISAVSTGDSVTVSWSAVTGATGYMVRLNGSDVYSPGTLTDCKFTGLKPSTDYNYKVCSRSDDGVGSFSPVKTIKTLPQAPAVPADIQKTSTENSATISWGAVKGATSYNVLFNGINYNLTGTSKTITGLSPNKSYNYSICAKNADGTGAYSSTCTVTTTSVAPANSSISANEGSVTISWSAVPGATGYDIIFNEETYTVTSTSKTFTGLSSNSIYNFQIRTKNADGSSSYSASKSVMTAPNPPARSSAAATKDSVTVSWDFTSGATSYDVLMNGTVYNAIGTSKTISNLVPGTAYDYQVRSNSTNGSSTYSPVQTVTTKADLPAIPENVSAASNVNTVTVRWNSAAGAKSYDVKFDGTVYNVTGTTRTFTNLLPGTSYSYAVCGKNSVGSSAYSTAKTIQTTLNPPGVPINVSATATNSFATVRWNDVAGAASYDVLFNGKVYNTTVSAKTIDGLSPLTNYTYAVRAKNAAGTSAYSATMKIWTLLSSPMTPTNIKATATTNSVSISWSAAGTATSYDILFNGLVYNITKTYREFTGLLSGTDYTYQVRARNAGGTSVYSMEKIIQTRPVIPGVPANVNAAAKAESVTVSWNSVGGAFGYQVLFDGHRYIENGMSATYTGLQPRTEHNYQVRAENAAGLGAYSPVQVVRTLLSTPADISAVAAERSITIKWNPVDGASGYNVRFNGSVYPVNDTCFEITGLHPDTEHSYSVCAGDTEGSSEYSKADTVKTLIELPEQPGNVHAASTLNSVIIKWSPVGGALSYDVEFDGKLYSAAAGPMASETMSLVLRTEEDAEEEGVKSFYGLKPNTEHGFQVRAVNKRGAGNFSPIMWIRPVKSQIYWQVQR